MAIHNTDREFFLAAAIGLILIMLAALAVYWTFDRYLEVDDDDPPPELLKTENDGSAITRSRASRPLRRSLPALPRVNTEYLSVRYAFCGTIRS